MRRLIAALCLVAVALVPACSRNEAPNSLFDAAGYHLRGDKVYYLSAFPGKANEIAGADAASFKAFDTTYAKDRSNAYFDGRPIPAADTTSFDVLNRSGFAKDRNHVYQLDRPISDDPAHFAIVSNSDHYLYTKDSRTIHVTGNPIPDADPATFRVLNAAFECSADAERAYYRQSVIAGADPRTFPLGRAVTNCTETSLSFAD